MATQEEGIRAYLESGATLTAIGALDLFGCFRLAARIYDLRCKGVDVQTRIVRLANGKRIAFYSVKTEADSP